VPAQGGEIPPNAVKGGHDNEDLYVGRARHEGALLPGKIVPSHGVCYVSWGGQEHGKNEYEVCGAGYTHTLTHSLVEQLIFIWSENCTFTKLEIFFTLHIH
jgi:hypothetical protein